MEDGGKNAVLLIELALNRAFVKAEGRAFRFLAVARAAGADLYNARRAGVLAGMVYTVLYIASDFVTVIVHIQSPFGLKAVHIKETSLAFIVYALRRLFQGKFF